ncbi:MAG: hypothetical protein HQ498_07750 [Pseudohongiella sp.]|nr:hypothetical protein [Pseudohongiella sp.]
MNYFQRMSLERMRFYRVGVLLVALGFSFLSNAQVVLSSIQAQIYSGAIEKTREDDGYITISGRDYGFEDELTIVYFRGEEIGVEILHPGLVVRYTLDGNNRLLTVEIIGPLDAIQILQDS